DGGTRGPSGQGRGEAPQARPPPATSRAGPEKDAMAVLDDAEATTYRMLQQVLQNHYMTYKLCLPYTLVACGALVALVCAQLDETRGALESVRAHMLADLEHSTRARRSAPPLAPFPAEGLAHDTPAHLAQVVRSLLADVCVMLTHQYGHTPPAL